MVLQKLSRTLLVATAFVVATFSTGLLPVATAYANQGNGQGTPASRETSADKPQICHPVNGKGELGNGWNLINPAEASSHIDEMTNAPKHISNDGLRQDMYAVNGTCPGSQIVKPDQPSKNPSAWTDVDLPQCGSTTIQQTRNMYTYTWNEAEWKWIETVTVQTQTRNLTYAELLGLKFNCKPEALVTTYTEHDLSCENGVQTRIKTVTIDWVKQGNIWVPTKPVTSHSPWTFVRNLNDVEKKLYNCKPEAVVKTFYEYNKTCSNGVEKQLITVTTDWVWSHTKWKWVPGTPKMETGEWIHVRDLNNAEKHKYCKVYVCKYVGIPGFNERLKKGNDGLVLVSAHAINHNDWDGTVPGWFNDAHNRSYVIGYENDFETPPTSANCPAPSGTPTKAPKSFDYCGTKYDYINIPNKDGVVYKINGNEVSGWVHASNYEVTVTAEADEGYVLKEGAQTSWTFTFSDEQCVSITKAALPLTDTNSDGHVGVGDTVTWEITVTNNGTHWLDHFTVHVTDDDAMLENGGYIAHLAPGESVKLKAYSVITSDDIAEVCGVKNTASFGANYSKHEIYRTLNIRGDDEGVKEYDFTGSVTAEATFDCPVPETPGQVLGTQNGGGRGAGAVLPAVLPATGGPSNSPLLIIVAAFIAYGAVYFLQGRRLLAHKANLEA